MFKSSLTSVCCVIALSAVAVAVTPSAGDKGCCTVVGMGNVDGSSDGLVTMGDLTVMIDHLFISLTQLACPEAGNVDLSTDGLITMGDLTVLIDHLFISLSPLPECPVIDIDGNLYRTVRIGDQVWMAEDLKVTHYRNGEPIPNETDDETWAGLTTGAYCEYDNDVNNVATYGRLYNWYAVNDSRGIAPVGWHVPSDDEWKQLELAIGMSQVEVDDVHWRGTDEGGKLKESGLAHWRTPNAGATNSSGFTALPGGDRYYGGWFGTPLGDGVNWWTSTDYPGDVAWHRFLEYNKPGIYRGHDSKRYGFGVRCVKDAEDNTVTDIDGNVYQTVAIGNQTWMAANLKVTHYRNGEPIPHVTNDAAWVATRDGAYCEYDNDTGNVATHGRLYNWYAASDIRNIAPPGWHVPTDDDWKQLEMYLGMSQAEADKIAWRGTDEGGKLKEAGTAHWFSPNTGATNESGFTALGSGFRTSFGDFLRMGELAYFWSSTPSSSSMAWARQLDYEYSQIYRYNDPYEWDGFSIRCVKDADDSTVTDIDGNVYRAVRIGDQIWMAENLKVTHFRNGEDIPHVTDDATWQGLTTGAYCEYNNDVDNVATYGRLYNWYAVNDSRNIAPTGWHVPNDADWQTLVDYLGGLLIAGGKMKEAGYSHWASPNTGATNESGFSGLPSGYRHYYGNYSRMGTYAYFWSTTPGSETWAWTRDLDYVSTAVPHGYYSRQYGFSVRCVRDY